MPEAYLSEDGRELSLVRIGGRPHDLFEGEWHMLKDNVEAVVGCESVEGSDDILVLKLSIYVQRLRGRLSCEYSHMDELNGRGLPKSHFHGATQFNVVDLLVLLPRGFPRCSEPEGATRRRLDGPRERLLSPDRGI
jgi:hypothetical protein